MKDMVKTVIWTTICAVGIFQLMWLFSGCSMESDMRPSGHDLLGDSASVGNGEFSPYISEHLGGITRSAGSYLIHKDDCPTIERNHDGSPSSGRYTRLNTQFMFDYMHVAKPAEELLNSREKAAWSEGVSAEGFSVRRARREADEAIWHPAQIYWQDKPVHLHACITDPGRLSYEIKLSRHVGEHRKDVYLLHTYSEYGDKCVGIEVDAIGHPIDPKYSRKSVEWRNNWSSAIRVSNQMRPQHHAFQWISDGEFGCKTIGLVTDEGKFIVERKQGEPHATIIYSEAGHDNKPIERCDCEKRRF